MKNNSYLLIVLSIVFIIGCSKGGTEPITGSLPQDFSHFEFDTLPIIIHDQYSAFGILGGFELILSADNLSAELIPIRSVTRGEAFVVNAGSFFTISPCTDCLKLNRIGLDTNGNIIAGFSLRHPFDKGNLAEPPSNTNRLDLDVFDLALILEPQDSSNTHYPLTGVSLRTDVLVNADGYTKELANLTGNHSVLPFVICYKNANNNLFEMGTLEHKFDLEISQSGVQNFNLYLTMAYGSSATKLERLEPVYYVPEFNRKSAWKIDVTPPEGDDEPELGNTWDNNDTVTEYDVTIDIYDWNHGIDISPIFPDPDNTDLLSATSDISNVTVEIPGMTVAIVSAQTSDSSSNGWDDPLTYIASFANENRIASGVYAGLVRVEDSRQPSTDIDWGDTDTLVSSENGFWLEFYEIPEFAAYQTFHATVIPVIQDCGPITGHVVDPSQPIEDLYDGQTVDFLVIANSANGGNPIVQYEMDYDFDGTTFDVDSSSTDGAFTEEGPFFNPNCGTTNEPITFTVAFRATDSCDPPNTTVFATHQITIAFCCGPITGEIISPSEPVIVTGDGQTVNFVVSADTSANGQPVFIYQVDYDYDGVIFQPDATSADGVFNHVGPFYNPNCDGTEEPYTYTVAFRASDCCIPPNITVFATCQVKSYCGAYGWARSVITYSDMDEGIFASGNMTDDTGNIYIWGGFKGTYDFDPDGRVVQRISTGDGYDSFICAYSPAGKFKWIYTLPNYDDHIGVNRVMIDSSGNWLISGAFTGTMDFNPFPEVDQYSSEETGIFLTKFSSSFDYEWTKVWSDVAEHSNFRTWQDLSDNIYLAGQFEGTVDFDPGPGVIERTATGDDFHKDNFIVKVNENGEFQDVVIYYGIVDTEISIHQAGFLSTNEIVLGGLFSTDSTSFDFDPGPGTYELSSVSNSRDAYVMIFDDQLNFNRMVTWGNSRENLCNSLSVMSNDNIVIGGEGHDVLDLDPGPGVDEHYIDCLGYAYISCFNSNLVYQYGRSWGGTNIIKPGDMKVDALDNIYLMGWMDGTVDFDPGPGIYEKYGRRYLTKFNSLGDFQWADTWVGTQSERPDFRALSIDYLGNIVISGDFEGTIDFNSGPDEDFHSTPGHNRLAIFLTKLLPNGLWE